jgi:gas vesicle protein
MGKGFLGFVFGGIVGAGVALLFAPRTGTETRSLVAEKIDTAWGQVGEAYPQVQNAVDSTVANAKDAVHADELREKIENARTVIAEQVAKNAQQARDAINDRVPVAAEKVNAAADVVRGKIDEAASKLKSAAATEAENTADAIATENDAANPANPAAAVAGAPTAEQSVAPTAAAPGEAAPIA